MDTPITDYIIVSLPPATTSDSSASHREFETLVKKKITEGLQPLGGPFVDGMGIHQAMVKHEADPLVRIPRRDEAAA